MKYQDYVADFFNTIIAYIKTNGYGVIQLQFKDPKVRYLFNLYLKSLEKEGLILGYHTDDDIFFVEVTSEFLLSYNL